MTPILKKSALAGALLIAGMAMAPGEASAITYATSVNPSITDNVLAGRGTANDRDNPLNAVGAPDGDFFEIGLNGFVDFKFDTPFTSPGSVIEITFGNRDNFEEFAKVEVGNMGDESSFVEVNESPIQNVAGPISFTFAGGPFDTVRLMSAPGTTVSTCQGPQGSYACGGFDVDALGVTAVPLPPALVLLLSSIGGLAFLGRRRATI